MCRQADTKLRIVLYQYKDPTCRSTADDNITEFAECPVGDYRVYLNANVRLSVLSCPRYYG
jgi:hypothetical protein